MKDAPDQRRQSSLKGIPEVDPQRSALMSRVKGKDSRAEMAVRRLAHALGYRFRLHRRDLPGSPDLVFVRARKAIFVHGCFWHRHEGCRRTTTPTTRHDFWVDKFRKNIERDERVTRQLQQAGWQVLVIWECEAFTSAVLRSRIDGFLGS